MKWGILDPERIPNNFRIQTYIEEEIAKTKQLPLEEKSGALQSQALATIALTFLEIGDFCTVEFYAKKVLQIESVKPLESQDQLALATAHYVLATKKRELNNCVEAIAEYRETLKLNNPSSTWLESNVLRNLGLCYIKMKNFSEATEVFKTAIDCAMTDSSLRGSLPALYNYYALSLTRGALAREKSPEEGLKMFERTTQLYQEIFNEKNISQADQLRSHDWQSHQFHRGMVLCELAEKEGNKKAALAKFYEAEHLLSGALEGRIANHADDQRLGDIKRWLSRVYEGLSKITLSIHRTYLEEALAHYSLAFPRSSKEESEAPQIQEIRLKLDQIEKASAERSPLADNSVFKAPPGAIPEASRVQQKRVRM